MTKIYLVAFLFFAFSRLSAQTRYQQFTVGGGAGMATAYAGADQPQPNIAFYGSVGYYPVPVFNVFLEGQGGALSGTTVADIKSRKSFNSNYKAVILDVNLFLGVFFDPGKNGFLNVIKNFYGGVGYGAMTNSINNADLANPNLTNHINNTINIVPFKAGYEYNILKNDFNEPVLKIDLSATFNYTIGKGLDGYYDNYSKAFNFYNYYALGLKYIFIIKATYGKAYNKFD